VEPESVRTLTTITAAVVAALPGAAYAGLARTRKRGHVAAQAPTHPIVQVLDDLQTALRQGPCVARMREQRVVHIADMSTDARWPDFAACAAQLGVGSMLSLQLFVGNEVVGTLNLYSPNREAFTGDDETLANVFANQAAIALHGVGAGDDRVATSTPRTRPPRWQGLVSRYRREPGAHRLKP
jgi:GAF domain-containing protein